MDFTLQALRLWAVCGIEAGVVLWFLDGPEETPETGLDFVPAFGAPDGVITAGADSFHSSFLEVRYRTSKILAEQEPLMPIECGGRSGIIHQGAHNPDL